MLLNLTEEQIAQLAPDAASVKAGKGLASRAKWLLLEYSDRAIWGHCQGSGQTPYQTVVDIKDIAFRCSCPSRKFPCKHALGLLYMYASYSESFKQAEEPDCQRSCSGSQSFQVCFADMDFHTVACADKECPIVS